MRRLIRNMLVERGAEVFECCDGERALAAYLRFHPDWVLMDIQIPGIDGIGATRQITAADPQAKVMIVTDYDDPQLRAAAQQAGARSYVTKENLMAITDCLSADQTH